MAKAMLLYRKAIGRSQPIRARLVRSVLVVILGGSPMANVYDLTPDQHWNGTWLESAEQPWSITTTGATTFRHELRAGDHYAGETNQRSEIVLANPSDYGSPGFFRPGTPVDI